LEREVKEVPVEQAAMYENGTGTRDEGVQERWCVTMEEWVIWVAWARDRRKKFGFVHGYE
jgi:hypothetical protein